MAKTEKEEEVRFFILMRTAQFQVVSSKSVGEAACLGVANVSSGVRLTTLTSLLPMLAEQGLTGTMKIEESEEETERERDKRVESKRLMGPGVRKHGQRGHVRRVKDPELAFQIQRRFSDASCPLHERGDYYNYTQYLGT